MTYAGMHLLVDLWGATNLNDPAHIDAALREAAEAAGATILHGHFHHFSPNGGVSGVLVLAESHISIHTWPERDFAAVDIFMCGACDPRRGPGAAGGFNRERIALDEQRAGESRRIASIGPGWPHRPFRWRGRRWRPIVGERNAVPRLGTALPGEARAGARAERVPGHRDLREPHAWPRHAARRRGADHRGGRVRLSGDADACAAAGAWRGAARADHRRRRRRRAAARAAAPHRRTRGDGGDRRRGDPPRPGVPAEASAAMPGAIRAPR